MHCGWMDKDRWIGAEAEGLPPFVGGRVQRVRVREHGVCPGYLVRLRSVVEATQARAAMEHHVLDHVFPDASHALIEGAQLSAQAFNVHGMELVREQAERAK